jgi:hypothetical protein
MVHGVVAGQQKRYPMKLCALRGAFRFFRVFTKFLQGYGMNFLQ